MKIEQAQPPNWIVYLISITHFSQEKKYITVQVMLM